MCLMGQHMVEQWQFVEWCTMRHKVTFQLAKLLYTVDVLISIEWDEMVMFCGEK